MGPVFRAYEPERDRLVAVKVFRLDLPPERVHQLVGEFERLIDADLRHPAITTPVATGLHGVLAYLAQDFFSGDSLDIVMRENGPMSVAQALRVARQLAEGLDFAAERDVDHGALNPRDVLLSPDGACIVGLGVTRALEHIGAATPIRRPYTSPERVAGEAWDRRADVFSLAAVVYEMLWGRRLVGTGMQAMEVMTPLPGTHLAALQAVFAGALADQAVDRFATATEFIESLERAASDDVATAEAVDEIERHAVRAPLVDSAELRLPLEDDVPDIALGEPLLPEPESEPRFALADPIEPAKSVTFRDLLEPLEPPAPLEPREPLEPPEPVEPLGSLRSDPVREPPFLASTPSFVPERAPRSASVVWPIGLACVIGLAIGFGVGYTVGIRDRGNVGQTAVEPSNAPAAPPQRTFTESPVGTRPAAEPKAENTPAPAVRFSGRIVVRSTPAGAHVFVDGRDRGPAPATVNDLAEGEHRVRIVHDGYATADRRVVLSAERPSQVLAVPLSKKTDIVAPKQLAVPPAKADVAPKPGTNQAAKAEVETGLLVLDSRPTGATAFVDGRAVGKTPVSVPGVKTGDHAVRFELAGHFPWTASVTVMGGTSNRVGGSLEKID